MSLAVYSLEPGQALHNMSAPPRSTLTLKPFQSPQPMAAGDGIATNWGLAWLTRVALDGLLLARWPRWARGLKSGKTDPHRKTHLRLVGALAIACAQAGVEGDPRALEPMLEEHLADKLLRRAQELILSRPLPPLMLATRALKAEGPMEDDPIRTLVILTHLTGRICEPGGSPLLGEALREGHALDLWVAEAPHA